MVFAQRCLPLRVLVLSTAWEALVQHRLRLGHQPSAIGPCQQLLHPRFMGVPRCVHANARNQAEVAVLEAAENSPLATLTWWQACRVRKIMRQRAFHFQRGKRCDPTRLALAQWNTLVSADAL
jgi:hypothetical protein